MAKNKIINGDFDGERSLFASRDIEIVGSRFHDGESPLKESRGVRVEGCSFEWKYPLWYCKDVSVRDTYVSPTARSGIWYTDNITMVNCVIDAPKTFRRCEGVRLDGVTMLNAQECLWSCEKIELENVTVRGDYFGMNCEDIRASGFRFSGNYAFDGAQDVYIEKSVIYSKDAFWNCKNVTVVDSVIVGEYIGWNSKNVKFINCDIESNQGFCYMKDLVLENCRLVRTDLAFEYSSVNADVRSHIDSVKNPHSGRITADSIGEIIHDPECVDTEKTLIEVRKK